MPSQSKTRFHTLLCHLCADVQPLAELKPSEGPAKERAHSISGNINLLYCHDHDPSLSSEHHLNRQSRLCADSEVITT